MNTQSKKPSPVIALNVTDYSQAYTSVTEALIDSIRGSQLSEFSVRGMASLAMLGTALPSADDVIALAEKEALPTASIKTNLSTLKTLAFLGTKLDRADVVTICANAKGGRLSDIKTLAESVIGGEYKTSGKTKEREWKIEPKKVLKGKAEKVVRAKQAVEKIEKAVVKAVATKAVKISPRQNVLALFNDIARDCGKVKVTGAVDFEKFNALMTEARIVFQRCTIE